MLAALAQCGHSVGPAWYTLDQKKASNHAAALQDRGGLSFEGLPDLAQSLLPDRQNTLGDEERIGAHTQVCLKHAALMLGSSSILFIDHSLMCNAPMPGTNPVTLFANLHGISPSTIAQGANHACKVACF